MNYTKLIFTALMFINTLVPTITFADGEYPTGLVNECGTRGVVSRHIIVGKLQGITREQAIEAFRLWRINILNTPPEKATFMTPVVVGWLNRVKTEQAFLTWVGQMYDQYNDIDLAFQKERLACEKDAAGESQ